MGDDEKAQNLTRIGQALPGRGTEQPDAAKQSSLRTHNLALVLDTIARHEPISRADVASAVGLTRATLSTLVDQLRTAGLIDWAPQQTVRNVGRPAFPVQIARATWAGIGIEVRADELEAIVLDLSGAELARGTRSVPVGQQNATETATQLQELQAATWSEAVTRYPDIRCLGTTLAVPGIVRGGVVLDAPNLDWVDIPIADLIAGTDISPTSETIEIANEATLAAAAEAQTRGGGTFIYLSSGIGLGGSLVVDGVTQRGQHGFAGELGHLTVDPSGPECHCGSRGCLELYASGNALDRLNGDEIGTALGIALAGVINVVDVATIVLGGALAPIFPGLHPALMAELTRRVLAFGWIEISVEMAQRHDAPALHGAALSRIQSALKHPETLL